MRVLNTRPAHQAEALNEMIRTADCVPIALPTLAIQALSTDWLTTLPPLHTIQKAIFVSANAVHYFFKGLQIQRLIWPSTIQTFAIGSGTAAALAQQAIQNIQSPDIADSEHVLALPSLKNIQQESILLISGEKGRPLLGASLRQRAAIVHHVSVYKRTLPKKNLPFTHTLWQDNALDIILMLSHEAIDNLFVLFEEGARAWLQSKPWIVISPRLVEIAHSYHVTTVIHSEYADIITTLTRLMHNHGREIS